MNAFRGNPLRFLTRWFALTCLFLTACGDYGSEPPQPAPPDCDPSTATEINEIAGDLVNVLYDVDVGFSLLFKGSTDGFRQTIGGHESFYERGEIYDATSGIVRMFHRTSTVRSLLTRLLEKAESDAQTTPLVPAIEKWSASIESQLALSDSLFALCIERGKIMMRAIDEDHPNEKVAMRCRLQSVGPGFSSLDEFVTSASPDDWAELIPSIFGCTRSLWSAEWYEFSQKLFRAFEAWDAPAWGIVSYNLLPEIRAAGVPGETITEWSLQQTKHTLIPVDTTPSDSTAAVSESTGGLQGEAVAILMPREGGGSRFESFFLGRGLEIRGLPAGGYDALVFSSYGRATAIDSLVIGETPDTTYFNYQPIADPACPGAYGRVDSWVYLPNPGPHLTNFCNCSCNTEIYEGTSYFQWPIFDDADGVENINLLVAEGTFRIIVDCESPVIRGTGTGEFRFERRSGSGCSYEVPAPASVSFAIEGTRFESSMELFLSLEDSTLSATRICDGEAPVEIDFSRFLLLYERRQELPIEGIETEVLFPPSADPAVDLLFARTAFRRVF